MFEYHGWVTIFDTPSADINEAMLQRAADRVHRKLAELGDQHLLDLRWVNGQPSAHFAGFASHSGSHARRVVDLYTQIARLAPGSYGLLYVRDPEDAFHGDEFRVHQMARGHVTEHADPFLSPVAPVVQDGYPAEVY